MSNAANVLTLDAARAAIEVPRLVSALRLWGDEVLGHTAERGRVIDRYLRAPQWTQNQAPPVVLQVPSGILLFIGCVRDAAGRTRCDPRFTELLARAYSEAWRVLKDGRIVGFDFALLTNDVEHARESVALLTAVAAATTGVESPRPFELWRFGRDFVVSTPPPESAFGVTLDPAGVNRD